MQSVVRYAVVLGLVALAASLVRAQTGACCGVAGSCSITPQIMCVGAFLGDGSVCAPGACDAVTGACCIPSGACTISTATLCKSSGGAYEGDGVSCADVSCPQPTGACCDAAGHQCTNVIENDCLSLGGTFYRSTVCTPDNRCPIGACCLPEGVCTAGISQPSCAKWRGTFQGVGTTCSGIICPMPVGACCTSTGGCALLTANFCAIFGQWRGPGTTCPTACLPPGVCCRGSTCATGVLATNCTAQGAIGATFISGLTLCNPSGGRAPLCCLTDFNKSGAADIQDVFDYLNAWFAQSPYADFGGDGSGMPAVQDIFDFLNAWFVSEC